MLALATSALSFSQPFTTANRVVLEPDVKHFNATTSTWFVHSYPAAETLVKLTTVLRIDDGRRALLEKTLYDVSDPKHAEYGNHKSKNEIAEILAVPQDQIDRVVNFWKLNGAAAVEVHPTKDTLTIAIAVGNAEKALSTRLATFGNPKISTRIVRATAPYSFPTELAADVAMVGELHQFPRPRVPLTASPQIPESTWPNTCTASRCEGFVTPSVLASRYSFPDTETAVKGNTMSIAEFQGQYYKPTDISFFNSQCGTDVKVTTTIGGNGNTAGTECELDIQYMSAVAPGTPMTDIYDASFSLLGWGNQLISLADPPLVNSVSYGNDEAQQTGKAYMESVNTVFMKAGSMGLSILFASGDQGVCGREGCGYFRTTYHPDFPAGSPYVTAVGGTDFAVSGVIGDEKAWEDGGGGFSNTFDMPSYQASAVAAYLANKDADLPEAKYFNATGRAYPDIAALAGIQNPYCVAVDGAFTGIGGTSAACPVASAIFARLNGLRLAKGGKPMGFLNPFIYQNPTAFNDVKLGAVKGGNVKGFKAITGWDAATGNGTPDYSKLAKLV